MDDLLGLSWDQKAANGASQPGGNARNGGLNTLNGQRPGGIALPGMATPPPPGAGLSSSGKVKPPVPPVSSKPANFQMNSKPSLSSSNNLNSLYNTSLSSASSSGIQQHSITRTNANALPQPLKPMMNSSMSSSSSAPKKPADDVFGALMSSFGQGSSSSDSTKNLSVMTLDERKRYDQQQLLGSMSSSPSYTSPMSHSLNSSGTGTPTARGFDPNNLSGSSSFSAVGSPKPQAFASPTPIFQQSVLTPSRNQSPSGFLASPGSMGRSISPSMTPLQPERSNNSSPAQSISIGALRDPFDTLLGDQVSRSSPAPKNQSLNSIRYNTPPLGQTASKPAVAADPWDLDFLANATAQKTAQTTVPQSDDVFDLGSFEHALPERPHRQRDSVDALNSFVGKQPSPNASSKPSPPVSKPAAKPPRSHATKASTDEDARIAQIVSMGFSTERAKLALAMTENGRDIEAAVEYLVQNDEAEDQRRQPREPSANRRREADSERSKASRHDEDDDPPLTNYRRRNQAQELTRAQQLQQQKDKLVGSASIFGMSVLFKANDLYKQGREKVQAVMEDMTAEEPRATSSAARRHEWIDDAPRGSEYKDSDSEDEVYKGRRQDLGRFNQQSTRGSQRDDHQPIQSTSRYDVSSQRDRKEKESFENTYVSSSRRGYSSTGTNIPSRNQQPLFTMDDSPATSKSGSSLRQSSSKSAYERQSRAPSPLPSKPARPPRALVQASSQQLAESNHFKEKGNEVFKLGQFGQAAEFYLRAGQMLPRGHLLLVVAQNNRAAALLKVGEYKETVSECDKSITLIQGPDGQGVNDVIPPSAGVNLKEHLGKALMRRATAYENLEKYKEAKDDWAKLRNLDPSHKNAVEGHRRCEKALALVNSGAVDKIATINPSVIRSPQPISGFGAPVRSSPMQDIFESQHKSSTSARAKAELERSEGVSKLRLNAAQQEREDDEKLRLTDQVDMKMTLWKAGKEDNIRALIASLGSVLWEGAGWKPVGMHELVTPSQVKIKYMRAIGKMHPDKLSASTTVEQRMMANTIFSTLNSAWDAFKVQNNM
ncbi:hypothetical protein BGZ81_005528 [Podila clonocystis]|nr:hypothetical protein BGZ81_005528 [Podila clonocystis]